MIAKRLDWNRFATSGRLLILLVISGWLCSGCGKGSDGGSEIARPLGVEPPTPVSTPRGSLSESDRIRLIHKVKNTRPQPGGPTIGAWVEKQVAEAGGPLLYSEWEVVPGKDGVHEVRFTYTWRSSSFQILNENLTWTVDVDKDSVTGPIEKMSDGSGLQDPLPEPGDTPASTSSATSGQSP